MITDLHIKHNHQNPDLNYEERKIIERLLRSNTPKKQIARTLNRNISTIRREIKRGSVEQRRKVKTTSKKIDIPLYTSEYVYYADFAQREYKQHRANCGAKRKTTECREFLRYVEGQVTSPAKWSLDAAAGRYKLHNPGQPISVGFPERTADIRMAQYEAGTRTPKADLVEALAYVLDVSP